MPRRAWVALVTAGLLGIASASDRPREPEHPRHRAEWLEADGLELRAVRAGRGDPTLLLLHGYGESLLGFRVIFDRLAEHHRVVAIDLPGFGLSDKPDGPYDLPTMQGHIEKFMDRWIGGPVAVVGHSMGGEIAAALAIARPDRVVAAVLIAPGGYGLSGLAQTSVEHAVPETGWLTAALSYLLPVHDPEWLAEPADRDGYHPANDRRYHAVLARVLDQFDFAALRNRFSQLRQPTLLIWGKRDPTIPYEIGQRIAFALPCVRFVTLPQGLHRPQQALPDTVLAEMRRFFQDPPGQTCGPGSTAG